MRLENILRGRIVRTIDMNKWTYGPPRSSVRYLRGATMVALRRCEHPHCTEDRVDLDSLGCATEASLSSLHVCRRFTRRHNAQSIGRSHLKTSADA